jgi:hypothetical protein
MSLREQSPTSLVLSVAALALAVLAGVVIGVSGGNGDRADTLSWTPPAATAVAAAAVAPPSEPATATAPGTNTRAPTATAAPTTTPTRQPATPAPAARITRVVAPTRAPATATPALIQVRISRGPANLRAGPGREFGITIVADEGASFSATGRTADGAWLRLCCVNDSTVWIAADLAEIRPGVELPVVSP